MANNHEYNTPDEGRTDWHLPLNDNFEQLDTDVEVRDREDTLGSYQPKDGAKFFAVDTGAVFLGDGTEWSAAPQAVLSIDESFQLPVAESDPDTPAVGELWFRQDLGELRVGTTDGVRTLSGSTGETVDEEPVDDSTSYDVVEPFDDSGWIETFGEEWDYGVGSNTSIRSVEGREGNQLQMRVPDGENRGVYTVHNHQKRTGSGLTECYHSFYLRFEPGFYDDLNDDGKLPGFAGRNGTSEGAGGNPARGTGWSARMGWDDPWDHGGSDIPLDWYIYHMDAGGSYGEHDLIALLEEGRWYRIEQYLDIGEPNTNDGVLRCWVDGNLEYDRSDLRWRESGGNDIQWTWWDFYHGGGNRAGDDIYVQFDDLKIKRGGMP